MVSLARLLPFDKSHHRPDTFVAVKVGTPRDDFFAKETIHRAIEKREEMRRLLDACSNRIESFSPERSNGTKVFRTRFRVVERVA